MRIIDYDRPQRGEDGRTKDGRPIVTREKYEAWITEVQENFERYRCCDCGSVVWHTKSEKVTGITLPCGEPCRGVMNKVAVPFVMGGGDEREDSTRSIGDAS